jgi:outer membrane receptor protein involved in Fe transport
VRAPLAQNRPGIRDLLFDTGYRRSDYQTSGVVNTYKFEVQYAPETEYRLRASYDRAIRAPSLIELFGPPNVTLIAYGNDPCAPTFNTLGQMTGPATFTLQQCLRTGATAAQYGNGSTTDTIPQGTAFQLAQEMSGNVALKPERAGTYTVGLNFAPGWIPRLTGSFDYYHIKVQDTIGTIPPSVILNTCANTGDPNYCSQLVRSPSSGGLQGTSPGTGGFFVQRLYNLGSVAVSGVDVQLNYRFDLPANWGVLRWELNGAYLQQATSQPLPGAHAYDCAGYFGFTCGTVNPHWRHNLRGTWDLPADVSVAATWRFIGPVSNDNNSPDPSLQFDAGYPGYDLYNARIPSYSYLDLEATWNLGKILTLRAGLNNVFDKDPPLLDTGIVASGAANTYSFYDLFGRQLFVAFTAKF